MECEAAHDNYTGYGWERISNPSELNVTVGVFS